MAKKINYQQLEKKLILSKKPGWEIWSERTRQAAFKFADEYRQFIDQAKTEREVVRASLKLAQGHCQPLRQAKSPRPGACFYADNKGQALALARLGRAGLKKGVNLIMAHIDSPRLDLKISPLYEEEGIAFFKTHYYGGIKKYQWPTIALALHGVVYLTGGRKVEIVIGEKENEPIFMITDLLPHLDRPAGPGSKIGQREIKAEELNLVVGSMPVPGQKIKQKVKLAVLDYLWRQYGIKEEDFASAELQAVPAQKARDLGFDRSLMAAYGHDDRICAFAALKGFLAAKTTDKTQVCFLVDREEIGSDGTTGAKSAFVESFFADLLSALGQPSGLSAVYRLFAASTAISADVTAALDPDYKEAHDVRNAHRLGYGVAIERYTGQGGKYFSSEASAKFIRDLRVLFSKNKNIVYQLGGGLGKVDQGGGGTIAKYLANRNIEVVDMGVPLFNMHAPLEIASKADLYAAYLAYQAFLSS